MKTRYFLYLIVISFMWACTPEIDEFTPSNGNADFTTYVALGNSLTAGYANSALYQSGQEAAWANILANQMKAAGGGNFVQPVVNSEQGVFPGKMKVGYSTDCLGNVNLGPVAAQDGDLDPFTNHVDYSVNNLGVPGAKAGHLLANGYGNIEGVPLGLANPYFVRFAATPSISVIEQAMSMQPTFFSLWIGNNDVLGYATSGGVNEADITPLPQFTQYYSILTQTLMSQGAKGVVANIPNITDAAFFTTVPYNAIVLTQQQQVDALNAAYAPYNTLMAQYGMPYRINFALGANPMIIYDKFMPFPPEFAAYKFRQIHSDEMVLLTIPQDSLKCGGWGTQKPVPDQYTLVTPEIQIISDAIYAYNQVISNAATVNGLAFVNFNLIIQEIAANGYMVDGVEFTTTYVRGNLFSLDGIHLTPQANAMVANYFIQAINSTYSAAIPEVNVSEYQPIILP
jgi:lysophospholipase L1-like esterase